MEAVAYTVREAGELLAEQMDRTDVKLMITGRHRTHDIRHRFADIRVARELFDYDPTITFSQGIAEMANWLDERVPYDRILVAS